MDLKLIIIQQKYRTKNNNQILKIHIKYNNQKNKK